MEVRELLELGDFVWTVLNAMPLPIFIVDHDVRVFSVNHAGERFLGKDSEVVLRRRAGDILHCVHSRESKEGCGRGPACSDCVVRESVGAVFRDGVTVRRKTSMELTGEGKDTRKIFLHVTASPLEYQGRKFALLVLQDISEVTMLKQIVPICSHCKKIRNDDQYWQSVEQFFNEHMDLWFSHGICPDCLEQYYPELCAKMKWKVPS
jgi:hypothetical protein